jgi:glycosyltransferase involved in cell wall biosynthesis
MVGPLDGDNLWHEYARTSALILPSTSEPWGLVVNEALTFGAPVVVSDACGCVPELVKSGVTGRVIEPEDSKGLAKAMCAIADSDRPYNDEVSRACQQIISEYTPLAAATAILDGCKRLALR